MDSKIILAVLIVALIGIVAATYQNETNGIMNSLANVATEDSQAAESVTDLAEANGEGSNSVQVDESIVQPDSSVNSKVSTTQKSSNNNQQSSSSNPGSSQSNSDRSSSNSGNSQSNSQSSNGNGASSTDNNQQSNNPSSSTQNSSSSTSGISEAEAMSIAKNSLPEGMSSDYQKVSEIDANGQKEYEVNLYKDGEIIASYEIDLKGTVTGGHFKGEVSNV